MNPHKTAITRTKLSRPALLIQNFLTDLPIVDYGAGKCGDTLRLRELGYNIEPYDKYNSLMDTLPSLNNKQVMCIYVLNTILEPERREVLEDLKKASNVFIAVRVDQVKGTPYQDGVITNKGTFQTQLTPCEWLDFFTECLGDVTVLYNREFLLIYWRP